MNSLSNTVRRDRRCFVIIIPAQTHLLNFLPTQPRPSIYSSIHLVFFATLVIAEIPVLAVSSVDPFITGRLDLLFSPGFIVDCRSRFTVFLDAIFLSGVLLCFELAPRGIGVGVTTLRERGVVRLEPEGVGVALTELARE